MLMQKSDGTFYLAVWDERVAGTGSDNVTVNLGRTYSAVDVYDPTVGASVQQQLNNVSSVTLSLSDHSLILAIRGPSVISSTPAGNTFGVVNDVRVTFDEAIDASTFTLSQVVSFTHTDGSGVTDLRPTLLGVNPVAESGARQFDISFVSQFNLGDYALTFGPDIRDLDGRPMDQDHNGIAGEVPDDEYTATFTIQGPKVVATCVTAGTNFLPNAFSSVAKTGPDGSSDDVLAVLPVTGSNFTQFDILCRPATAAGSYAVVIGPYVQDVFGNYMDQNNNLIPGETSDDAYTTGFTVAGPQVISTTLTGTLFETVTTGRFVFDRPMDVTTFTTDQFQIIGPDGVAVPVTAVTAVPYTNNTQFDISFALTPGPGTYMLQVGPNLKDVYGNVMDAPYIGTFTVVS
jgi:hypothetical protein